MNKNCTLSLKISLQNASGESFMGIGLVWLLQRIDTFRSIRRAAEDMGMSYMKALKIINRLEKNLQEKLLVRTIGGKEQGGSELTGFAREFLAAYTRFTDSVQTHAEEQFRFFISTYPE